MRKPLRSQGGVLYSDEVIQGSGKHGIWSILKLDAFKSIWRVVRTKAPYLALCSLLLALHSALVGVESIYTILFIKMLMNAEQTSTLELKFAGYEFPLPNLFQEVLWDMLFFIIILFCFNLFFFYVTHVFSKRLRKSISLEIRGFVLENLSKKNINYYTKNKASELLALMKEAVPKGISIIDQSMLLISACFNILVTGYIMFEMVRSLTVLLIAGFIIIAWLQGLFYRKVVFSMGKLQQSNWEFTDRFMNTLYGIRLIFTSGQLQSAFSKNLKTLRSIEEWSYSRQIHVLRVTLLRKLLMTSIVVVFFLILKFTKYHVLLKGSIIIPFIYLCFRLLTEFKIVDSARANFIQVVPHLRVLEYFLGDKSDQLQKGSSDTISQLKLQEGISAKGIQFSYIPQKLALSLDELHFRKGTATAIVGLSGSGKSTLLDILSGLQEFDSGEILCDGRVLSTDERFGFQALVGYASQESIIFNDSIRENLLFGCENASEEQLQRAMHICAVDEFLPDLQEGLDTVIGDRGLSISGGQRQRINLARLFMRDFSLILLDEATNALDLVTEKKVYERILELKKDRIIIVAAHRLSAISHFDQIIVMAHGEVQEKGTHKELIAEQGLYYNLYNLQKYEAV